METKYDWESNIKMNILTLRALGLWPKGDTTYKPGLYMLHAAILLTVLLLGHLFFQAVNIYFIRTNLEAVTGTIYVLLVEMIVVFKVNYLVRNMGMVKQLLSILKTDMFQPKNSEQIGAIHTSLWFWRIIYNILLYSCIGTNMFWAIYPLMDRSAREEKRLPFLAWYPFDTSKSPAYEITYIYQVISVCTITTLHVNIDALVAALNVFNGSQFDILCDNLRNLHKLGGSIAANFLICVKHHKEILSFSDRFNKFLNWILFIQFFIFTFCIGMTLFQLTVVAPMSSEFYSLVAYGLAITTQIFMYCWFGNEIEVKSSKIPYATFECDWTSFSLDVKKMLLFFTLRAQKPVKLSALNLFYLSLETFLRILKTSYSYFALLQQVNADK
ncbi:hypothetical protein Zmor_007887 [Zophobas morio]|uniref:Odorant receptor n=1 Tax=Zophobas morio TaxID=2755281 RepID=A0AA38IXW3_9CUCU|nr:hypothetical protein Zmor_007887 [Zophobas morio]